ncbi:MAG: PKD domain-containing protein, partial [Aquificae bacterium]|nr:PKD domain-containing protein [Aquificota bacterium]
MRFNTKRRVFGRSVLLGGLLTSAGLMASCTGGGGGGGVSTSTTTPPTPEEEVQTPASTIAEETKTVVVTTPQTTIQEEPNKAEVTTSINKGIATLTILKDNGEVYLNSEGKPYQFQVVEDEKGRYIFNIKVPADAAKAILKVEKEGYVPYEKVIELGANEVKVQIQELVTAVTKVVEPEILKSLNNKFVIALTKDGNLKTYDSVVKALSDYENVLVISANASALKDFDKIQKVKATLRTFEPTPADLQIFPGEFKTDKGENLITGGFNLNEVIAIYENGTKAPLKVIPNKAEPCTWTVERYLSSLMISSIKEQGDFDPEAEGCQVPIYTYLDDSGVWTFVGPADVKLKNGTPINCEDLDENKPYEYTVNICVTNEELPRWINIDWIATQQFVNKSVCIELTDQNGKPVYDAYVAAGIENYYDYSTTNSSGIARLDLIVRSDNVEEDLKSYTYRIFAFDDYKVYSGAVLPFSNGTDNCDYYTSVTVINPYNATLVVKLNANATLGEDLTEEDFLNEDVGYVCVSGVDTFYYKCDFVDLENKIVVPVKQGYTYRIYGPRIKTTEVKVENDFQEIVVNLENNPPEVQLLVKPNPAKEGEPVSISIIATDVDGDFVEITDFKINGLPQTYQVFFSTGGYLYAYTAIVAQQSGEISVQVKDSIGAEAVSTQTLTVLNNLAPIISGVEIYSDGEKILPERGIYTVKVGKEIKLIPFGYDPDGDEIEWIVEAEGLNFVKDENAFISTVDAPGNYTVTIKASDNQTTTEYQIQINAKDAFVPKIEDFAVISKGVLWPGQTYKVTFTVVDLDTSIDNISVSGELLDQNGTVIAENVLEIENKAVADNGIYNFQAKLTIPENLELGNYVLKLSISDEEFTVSDTLEIKVGNLPPKVEVVEAVNTVPIGQEAKFVVKVEDPDLDEVTVEWLINGELTYSETAKAVLTSEFTYVFETPGTYTVELVVKDSFGNEVKSDQLKWTITVYDPNKEYVFFVPVAGIYVAALDEDFNVKAVAISDETGKVALPYPEADTVNLAFVVTPEAYLTKDQLWQITILGLASHGNENTTLTATDWNEFLTKGEIPAEVLKQLSFPKDAPKVDPNLTDWNSIIELLDSDKNGFITKEEVYNAALSKFDANKNNIIEFNEYAKFYYGNLNTVGAIVVKGLPTDQVLNYHFDPRYFGPVLTKSDTAKHYFKFVEIKIDDEKQIVLDNETTLDIDWKIDEFQPLYYRPEDSAYPTAVGAVLLDPTDKYSLAIKRRMYANICDSWGCYKKFVGGQGLLLVDQTDDKINLFPGDLKNATVITLKGTSWLDVYAYKNGMPLYLTLGSNFEWDKGNIYTIDTELPKYGNLYLVWAPSVWYGLYNLPITSEVIDTYAIYNATPLSTIKLKDGGILEFKTDATAETKLIAVAKSLTDYNNTAAVFYIGPYEEIFNATKILKALNFETKTLGNLYEKLIDPLMKTGYIKIHGANLYIIRDNTVATLQDFYKKLLKGEVVTYYDFEVSYDANYYDYYDPYMGYYYYPVLPVSKELIGPETHDALNPTYEDVINWILENKGKEIRLVLYSSWNSAFIEDVCTIEDYGLYDSRVSYINFNCNLGNLYAEIWDGVFIRFLYSTSENQTVETITQPVVYTSPQTLITFEDDYNYKDGVILSTATPEISEEELKQYTWTVLSNPQTIFGGVEEVACYRLQDGLLLYSANGTEWVAVANYTINNGKLIVTFENETAEVRFIEENVDGNLAYAVIANPLTKPQLTEVGVAIKGDTCLA